MTDLHDSLATACDLVVSKGDIALLEAPPALRPSETRTWSEITTLLQVLGYNLPEDYSPQDWQRALYSLGLGDFLKGISVLSEVEIALRNCVSMDGDFRLTQLPAQGEVSLNTRIIHLRLKALGLFPYEVQAPYGSQYVPWEDMLRACLPGLPASALDVVNLLGDVCALWEITIAAFGNTPTLLLHGDSPSERSPETFENVRQEWWPRGNSVSEEFASPHALFEEKLNHFGLRIMRMTLWVNGMLSVFPSAAQEKDDPSALLAALYARGWEDPVEQKAFLRPLEDDYWALNLDVFTTRFAHLSMDSTNGGVTPALSGLLLGASPNGTDDSLLRQLQIIEEPLPPAPTNAIQRLCSWMHRGLQRMIEAAKNALHQGLDWVRDHILLPAKQLAAQGLSFLTQGWVLFKEVVLPRVKAFFLGLREDTSQDGKSVVISKIESDGDIVVIASRGTSSDVIQAHGERLSRASRNWKTALNLFGRILGLLLKLSSGPVGWLQAVIQIGSLVMESFSNHKIDQDWATGAPH